MIAFVQLCGYCFPFRFKSIPINAGPLDVLSLPESSVSKLHRCEPTNNGDWDPLQQRWVPGPRSSVEAGPDWVPREECKREIVPLISASKLGSVLAGVPVRVISARSYNYIGGDSFYDGDMKRWAAAEHSVQFLVSRNGAR